jgi:hypothetical protein
MKHEPLITHIFVKKCIQIPKYRDTINFFQWYQDVKHDRRELKAASDWEMLAHAAFKSWYELKAVLGLPQVNI